MNDDELRVLLADAVDDVDPRPGLDRIRARTARPVRRGRWVLAVAGAGAATAATVAAVSLLGPGQHEPGAASQGGPAGSSAASPRHRTVSSADGSLTIASPGAGSTVASPFVVQGRAATFEGNVQWELRQGSTVVERGFTTAGECCTLSPYSFSVRAEPGDYTLVVHDEDVSDGEGDPPAMVTEPLTVH
jgi:hypothetical protein